MILVPATSRKPSSAALPVSPEVAVRIHIFLSGITLAAETAINRGRSWRAMSLKAQVGPCHSSSI